MNNQEAIEILQSRDLKPDDVPMQAVSERKFRTAINIAIEALKHQEQYRWHDLRKNPEDLPGEDDPEDFYTIAVSGIDEEGIHCENHAITACYLGDGDWWVCKTLKVIGWKHTEPFEEGAENETD